MALSRNVKITALLTTFIIFITFSFYGYQMLFADNLRVDKEDKMLYIPTGADFHTVLDSLEQGEFLHDKLSFAFLSKLVGYQDKVRPGAYLIKKNASNKDVIRMLKAGRQTPIKLTFNNIRLKSELVQKLSTKLEPTAAELSALLNNPDTAAKYGFDTTTIVAMFIPNTYEVYWNISAHALLKKMHKEYNKFWTDERKAKAASLGLSPVQVATMASIVEAETKKRDEMPCVAGVYLNRIAQAMPLQADPTVVFAVGDFTIKRVLKGHKEKDSPYNTYKYNGLPPGPINLPSITALDAVLNPLKHEYIFFCAREDFSGYHNFTKDYDQHMKNARIYQKALDSANIH